ncbi:BrnT family toxin [Sphingomonas sp. CA1-15]|uniref:BrnT family toxin n=2 Tax=Sphingomonas immobilis TaxID=3063997 RepID=A0ABT9A221_9SPHN|nr:BrnT family toxin [Sphingomonas sp. CA1-15]
MAGCVARKWLGTGEGASATDGDGTHIVRTEQIVVTIFVADRTNRYYKYLVIIVWDGPKRDANPAKHGFDFAELGEEFFLSAQVEIARSDRFKAVGRLNDGTIAVIFATLGTEGISIISMRRASRMERKLIDDENLA